LLEDEGYECVFGNNKCIIKLNHKVVGLETRQGMLYMLSLNDFPVMNLCDVTNKCKRSTSDNETSSKLWHYRLGHISRGRMEHLIKEEILHTTRKLVYCHKFHCNVNFFVATGMCCCHQSCKWLRYVGSIIINIFCCDSQLNLLQEICVLQ
jgi:hypothetical protein